jgi:hypothetical protein
MVPTWVTVPRWSWGLLRVFWRGGRFELIRESGGGLKRRGPWWALVDRVGMVRKEAGC